MNTTARAMAFVISVLKEDDLPLIQHPPSDDSPELVDRWMQDARSRTLYQAPLGSSHMVSVGWVAPAADRGLLLLASIDRDGLVVRASQFVELEEEIGILERYWESLDAVNEEPVTVITYREDGGIDERIQSVSEHLQERAGYLREAIRMARAQDGVIDIR